VVFAIRPATAVFGVLTLGAGLTACSDDDKTTPPGAGAGAPPAAASSSPPPEYHPFNGGETGLNKPVMAVKIENTAPALPQFGVRSADIVYVEQIEGGETRLMAIYSSELPKRVGPIRSARVSDIHILRQYGRPGLAFSGTNPQFRPELKRAPLIRVSEENAGSAFYRWGPKPAPYNLYGDPKKLIKKFAKADRPRDIGFRFGPPPAGGESTRHFTARWPSSTMGFHWSGREKRWLASWGGRPDMAAEGGRIGGKTVVIQYAKHTRSRYKDVTGAYTPVVHTVGGGSALVLRDGKSWKAKWTRRDESKGTTFTTEDGKPINFAPGQVWIVLVQKGKPRIP
jgi:DUF3048 family protein